MNENEQKKEALCAKKKKKNCLLLPNAHLHSQEKSFPKEKQKNKTNLANSRRTKLVN
jgi:hypothetical protein